MQIKWGVAGDEPGKEAHALHSPRFGQGVWLLNYFAGEGSVSPAEQDEVRFTRLLPQYTKL